MIEDRRGQRVHAQQDLVGRGGATARAHLRDLLLERGAGADRVCGVQAAFILRRALLDADRPGRRPARPCRARWHAGRARAGPRAELDDRVALQQFEHHHLLLDQRGQRDRLAGLVAQLDHLLARRAEHVEAVAQPLAEHEELHAGGVALRDRVLLHVAAIRERAQVPVHRGLGSVEGAARDRSRRSTRARRPGTRAGAAAVRAPPCPRQGCAQACAGAVCVRVARVERAPDAGWTVLTSCAGESRKRGGENGASGKSGHVAAVSLNKTLF